MKDKSVNVSHIEKMAKCLKTSRNLILLKFWFLI